MNNKIESISHPGVERIWQWIKINPGISHADIIDYGNFIKIDNTKNKLYQLEKRKQIKYKPETGYIAVGDKYMKPIDFEMWELNQSKGVRNMLINTSQEPKVNNITPSETLYTVSMNEKRAQMLLYIQQCMEKELGFTPSAEEVVQHALYLTTINKYNQEPYVIGVKTTTTTTTN